MIKIIVAYDENKLIGMDDKLPWNIKEDLKHFKKETLNQTILMGDKTFFGIGKPLPNRKTIILTLDENLTYDHPNVEISHDINSILSKYKNNPDQTIIICGGATIYKLFLPHVDEIIVSKIKGKYVGNVYFPNWNVNEFVLISSEIKNSFTIKKFKRK